MSRRILILIGMLGLGWVAPIPATVGPPVSIRLLGEPEAAVAGKPYEAVVELKFTGPVDLEDIVVSGEGWSLQNIEPIRPIAAKAGDVVQVPFVALPSDAEAPLVVTLTLRGRHHSAHFYLSERELARQAHPRPVRILDAVGPVPADTSALSPGTPSSADFSRAAHGVAFDDSDDLGQDVRKKARNIRVRGRFGYYRTDGPFIGGDSVWVRVWDRDDLWDEELASVVTDAAGNFDVTFFWNPCAVSCDGEPDLYVTFDLMHDRVDLTTTSGAIYGWATGTTNDYTGSDLNYGTMAPGDESDDPAVHIFTNLTRTWRWLADRGKDNPKLPCRWPDGSTGAWWDPAGEDVHISTGDQWSEAIHSHEYGHDFMNSFAVNQTPEYCNGICDLSPIDCGHCLWCEETDHDAWNEGFPDWLGDIIPRDYAGTYGLAPFHMYNFEGLGTCGGVVDDPNLTEGLLAAVLRDIEDSTNDDHGVFAGVQDVMSAGTDEILDVMDLDHPLDPMSFLLGYKNRYPSQCELLWETAKNCGYEIDVSNPGVVTSLASPSHALNVDSPDNSIQFTWNVAPDDCSGIQGYGIAVYGTPIMPAAMVLGDVTTYTSAPLPPGTYYFSIRARDRANRWSDSYAWSGPYVVRTPEAANLTHHVKTGWEYPVLPRQTDDASSAAASTPSFLTGNTVGTYWNTLGINDGESDISVGFQARAFVDDVQRSAVVWGAVGAGQTPDVVNWGNFIVSGGRHTFETRWDALEQVAETSETDNDWARQWIWSPQQLAIGVPVTRNAPPDSDGGWASVVGQATFYNCDGLRMTDDAYWEAIEIRATDDAQDYDARLHLGSTGAASGFASNVGHSARVAGCLDAVIINRNNVGFAQAYDVGVLNHFGGTSTYIAASRKQNYHAFGDSLAVTFVEGEMLKLREFYVNATQVGAISITVDIDAAQGPIYALWLDRSFTTGDLLDYDAFASSDASGRARLDLNITSTGYNCLVIYRDQKDGTGQLSATVEIGKTPPDFVALWAAGWHSPLVPRSTFDGTPSSVPQPTTLPGNVASTYLNVAARNDSPSAAPSLPAYVYNDGVYVVGFSWGAAPAYFDGLFNWNYALTVRGGRHQLSVAFDPLATHEEIYESNNVFGQPWIWTGMDLPLNAPVSRLAPPMRTGGWDHHSVAEPLWYNCDGFQSSTLGTTGNWSAFAVLPNGIGADVDLRLHPHSLGAKNGFGPNLAFSGWGPGQSDFVVVNGNLAGFPVLDAGVLSTNDNGAFTIEALDDLFLDTDPEGIYGPFTIGSSRILNLHEVYLPADVYIVHLRPSTSKVATPIDWGLSILPHDQPYLDKFSSVPNGFAQIGSEGQGEVVTVQITEAAYYAVAVWKASSDDRLETGEYRLEFFQNITDVEDVERLPLLSRLAEVQPNPFNPRTAIHFELARSGQVRVEIFDARGQLVRVLLDELRPAGRHELDWDGIDARGRVVASGVYHVRLATGGVIDQAKLVLLK